MRAHFTLPRLGALTLSLVFSAGAVASEESQLIDSINAYRSQIQLCAGQASQELPPLSADTRLVLPAGVLKVRSNDTDYPFRPDTAFAYYAGLGTDEEPDSVLVVEPSAEDPSVAEATYFFRPRAGTDP